jgi:hypothetical protein
MNDRTAGAVLLVIGVVATFAAIVGGGIKIQQIEVGSVPSKWRQWLLGTFGLVIGFVGLIMVLPDDKPADETTNVQVVDENATVTDENAATADENGVADAGNSGDENATVTTEADRNDGEGESNPTE